MVLIMMILRIQWVMVGKNKGFFENIYYIYVFVQLDLDLDFVM